MSIGMVELLGSASQVRQKSDNIVIHVHSRRSCCDSVRGFGRDLFSLFVSISAPQDTW